MTHISQRIIDYKHKLLKDLVELLILLVVYKIYFLYLQKRQFKMFRRYEKTDIERRRNNGHSLG